MFQATAICRLSIEAAKASMNGYASLHKGAISRLSMKVGTAWTKSYGSLQQKAMSRLHEPYKLSNHSYEGFKPQP